MHSLLFSQSKGVGRGGVGNMCAQWHTTILCVEESILTFNNGISLFNYPFSEPHNKIMAFDTLDSYINCMYKSNFSIMQSRQE